MDIEQARFNMVEQQIRTWDVLDQKTLEALSTVKREHFVPEAYQGVAFADVEIPLVAFEQPEGTGEHMLFPKLDARILQALQLQGAERVLEIGTGSGYFTALLAQLAKTVVSIEIDPFLVRDAKQQLSGYVNIELVEGDGSRGIPGREAFDVIVISGSVPVIPAALFAQLAVPGKLIAIVGKSPIMTLSLFEQREPGQFVRKDILETDVLPYIKNVEMPRVPLI